MVDEARRHLTEAEGWFDLGNLNEAASSLNEIAKFMRATPDYLELLWKINAAMSNGTVRSLLRSQCPLILLMNCGY